MITEPPPVLSIFIYDIFIRLYRLSILLASPFSLKAKSWIVGRKKLFPRLRKNLSSIHGKKIWFHCASLGEFEQARPLIEKIRAQHPDHKIILTFFSPSGYDVRRYYEGVDYVSYLPIDTAENARKFVGTVRPSLVIWVKYDYWYHFLNQLHVKGIPVILISAVIRKDHVFFKKYGEFYRHMLGLFTHIFVQNQESKELLNTIGVASEVCSDTRFDRVAAISQQRKQYDNIAAFKGDNKLFIAGSTWAKDADLICKMINGAEFKGEFKYIIAPHNVTNDTLRYLLSNLKKRVTYLSRVTIQSADEFDVIIVDGIGALSSLYYFGDIAYIGGGFDASIHNILEPAVYGMPVIFGPHHHKSLEAQTLMSHPEWQAGHSIATYEELTAKVSSLIADDDALLRIGKKTSKEYVLANTGGTDRIYSYLIEKSLL